MRLREKLLILFAAVILSSLGFYLISSPFADLHMLAKKADAKKAQGTLARYDNDSFRSRTVVDSSLPISRLNFYGSFLRFLCAPGSSM